MKSVIPLFLVITTISLFAMQEDGKAKFYQLPTDQIPEEQHGSMKFTLEEVALLRAAIISHGVDKKSTECTKESTTSLYENDVPHKQVMQIAVCKRLRN